MSKKTANKRSTKSAIRALKRKRYHANNRTNYEKGGRVKKYVGGLDIPYDQEVVDEAVMRQQQEQRESDPIINNQPDDPIMTQQPPPATDEASSAGGPSAPEDTGGVTNNQYVAPTTDIAKVGETTTTDYDAMANLIQSSRGAQDFGIKYSYDPETGRFIEDISAFGFEGDMRYNYYTPEEFSSKYGIDMSQYQSQGMDPSLSTK